MKTSTPSKTVKPVVVADHDSSVFWKGVNNSRFLFQRCETCKKAQFYPRSVCSHCKSRALSWEESAGRGRVASFSVIHRAPIAAFKGDVPYVLALVDLEEGVRFMCNVVNCNPAKVRIGSVVKVVYERREGSEQMVPQSELCE
jgi:uncharacterized OB-fold protein